MENTDIPRDEWSDFFDTLGLQYEGWRTTVERIESTGDEEDIETRECSIEAMNAEVDDGEDIVVISFTDDVPLTIMNPLRVSMEENEEGRDNLLEIESATELVRLWLRFPQDGDMLDEDADTEPW